MTDYHNHCKYNDGQDPDLFAFFVKLRKLLEKKYVNFWYAKYLKKYIQNGISPYGVRVQIFDNLGNISATFKNTCEKIPHASIDWGI